MRNHTEKLINLSNVNLIRCEDDGDKYYFNIYKDLIFERLKDQNNIIDDICVNISQFDCFYVVETMGNKVISMCLCCVTEDRITLKQYVGDNIKTVIPTVKECFKSIKLDLPLYIL